jgi:hypothetical protein
MCLTLVLVLALGLASVVSYDRKWRYNLEHHLLMTLALSFMIVLCLWYRPQAEKARYKDIHCNLLQTFVNYVQKRFITLAPVIQVKFSIGLTPSGKKFILEIFYKFLLKIGRSLKKSFSGEQREWDEWALDIKLLTALIEQHMLDTNAGKQTVLRCHRCLINTGVEKMNNI